GFARRFGLRMSADFGSLFRCWNTGEPDGQTSDPGYVEEGIRRMALYRQLMAASPGGRASGDS
ncbi:MAG: hypothetical protein KGM47_04600, partial [Acidobacteriota bacterium]|nr:hypothetical protein [Acidobacteriota bacterium]